MNSVPDIATWPRVEAVLRSDGTGDVTIGDAIYPLAAAGSEAVHELMLDLVAERAGRIGKSLRLHLRDDSGDWRLIVGADHSITEDYGQLESDGIESPILRHTSRPQPTVETAEHQDQLGSGRKQVITDTGGFVSYGSSDVANGNRVLKSTAPPAGAVLNAATANSADGRGKHQVNPGAVKSDAAKPGVTKTGAAKQDAKEQDESNSDRMALAEASPTMVIRVPVERPASNRIATVSAFGSAAPGELGDGVPGPQGGIAGSGSESVRSGDGAVGSSDSAVRTQTGGVRRASLPNPPAPAPSRAEEPQLHEQPARAQQPTGQQRATRPQQATQPTDQEPELTDKYGYNPMSGPTPIISRSTQALQHPTGPVPVQSTGQPRTGPVQTQGYRKPPVGARRVPPQQPVTGPVPHAPTGPAEQAVTGPVRPQQVPPALATSPVQPKEQVQPAALSQAVAQLDTRAPQVGTGAHQVSTGAPQVAAGAPQVNSEVPVAPPRTPPAITPIPPAPVAPKIPKSLRKPGNQDGNRSSFLAQDRPEAPARQGIRGALTKVGIPVQPGTSERTERADIEAIQQHWSRPRTIAIVNGKGGAGKTPTTALLSAVFARFGGAGVIAWDNNQTRGTLGWRTEQDQHEATLMEMLPQVERLLGQSAQSTDLAKFVHHQVRDRYDVLRSKPMALAHEQRVDSADVDAIHAVVSKYYRMIFIDSGNDESDPMWLRMIDHADQLVVATSTRDDHAEAGALLLEALAGRNPASAFLADRAVVVVSQADPRAPKSEVHRIARGYRDLVREMVTIPYDPAMVDGILHFDELRPVTQRAWLSAAAAVARGL